ncbi:hypothetical protein SLEP1_g46702 [Rubroshorea leprosula]|uniref:Uncharacterized protein n=1 Tax=Rubroshorea leprosula TaxID=152421 RepID=A0AAV5LNT7_9ROSI|nr:hypothetical protein SLEP1_g46702 [Rubroshorea leprosula]
MALNKFQSGITDNRSPMHPNRTSKSCFSLEDNKPALGFLNHLSSRNQREILPKANTQDDITSSSVVLTSGNNLMGNGPTPQSGKNCSSKPDS